jgi:leucyl-tRNA synthetase
MAYEPSKFESHWQNTWDKNQTFKTEGWESKKPKYYILDMFPYPSGSGLHVGHPEGYTATDILARYKRARGFNVLHPMGWDAFGLPAEQHALKTGVHPAITTGQAIDNFRRQLKMLGFSYDWNHEISTCDPDYYKWTQFIFLKLFEKGLAYQTEVPVNWCPELKTVLANEEVVDGKSERGGHPVFRVPMKQWMLKITAYAERLLEGLDRVDWPEGTKELQRNWIGKSEGLRLKFKVQDRAEEIEIFTTRPDTLFGATYMVLAPEHPLVAQLTSSAQKVAVEQYRALAAQKSEIARQDQAKDKTGVWTGASAINPVSQQPIPIWISDYVMMGYGTGAIMAVPAHDQRDFEFAKTFQLPIITVVTPPEGTSLKEGELFSGDGVCVNSGMINGQKTSEAKETIIHWAEEKKLGTRTIQYKLRDWLFSRQRYWGEPFPIVHSASGAEGVPLALLPVTLPEVQSYEPSGTGESPLASISSWVNTQNARGESARRETDTMPGSAGSSWYFLRYCDPWNKNQAWSPEAEKYWMPVDLYLGGPEHAVGHLLYSRFWTKVLFDCGLVTHDEPFQKLVHQGMILGEDGEKMSKSRGNVINPDDVVKNYGADTLRLYEMFMGPLERDKPWSTQAIEGVYRFAQRTWRAMVQDDEAGNEKLLISDVAPSEEDLKILHKTIKKVTEDIENLRFNTAISQMMIFINHFTKIESRPRKCFEPFLQVLHPFTPHLAEELWARLGHTTSIQKAAWPEYDLKYAKDDQVTIAVQVMGKTRATLAIELGTSPEEVERLARAEESVARHLSGKTIKKVIQVPNKIINFVAVES